MSQQEQVQADLVHGIQPDWMDVTADPGVNFYQFACGGWISKATMAPDETRWSTFDVLRDRTLTRVNELVLQVVQGNHARGTIQQKLKDFYLAAVDEATIESMGLTPLLQELVFIESIESVGDLVDSVARMHEFGVDVLFQFGAAPDYADASRNIAHFRPGGLGLPHRDYYSLDPQRTAFLRLRQQYEAHISRMFQLMGAAKDVADFDAAAVLEIETALAHGSLSVAEMRQPTSLFHKMTVADLQEHCPNFPFDRYFLSLDVGPIVDVNVAHTPFFHALDWLLCQVPRRMWVAYLKWHLVHSVAGCLSTPFVEEDFDFYRKTLGGAESLQPRWKRAMTATNEALGDAVGELYVDAVFPPENKQRIQDYVSRALAVVKATVAALPWMDEDTRQEALAKFEDTVVLIGYPDKWKDYSSLEVDGCYVWNVLRSRQYEVRRNLAKINQPVDRHEWVPTPQTVNAYSNQQKKSICFPAGILQPPFFDSLADIAAIFGGIILVICHEIFHWIDDKGAEFDARGNLRKWISALARAKFDAHVAKIIAQYGSYQIGTGEFLNGKLVAGEATADLCGAKFAYKALEVELTKCPELDVVINGFTARQRFWIAFAQLFAGIIREEALQRQVSDNPHPPQLFRVNGTVANLPEWARDFGLPPDCPMLLPEEDRCSIW